MISRLLTALVAAALACTAGCAGAPDVAAGPETEMAIPVYRLGADDRIRINVYGEEALSGEYLVGSDGRISFPLLGMVEASGLTVAELRDALAQRLAEAALNDPKVSVDIVDYRPFYVLGEVQKAGQYPYRTGMTVMAAIATAGGFTYRANQKTVMIQHYGEPVEKSYRLSPQTIILPGDTIRVRERHF